MRSTISGFFDLVKQEHPDAVLHYYEKYPGKIQKVIQPSFYVDEYMKSYPCLKPECPYPEAEKSLLPEKFVTVQVDAGSKKRMLKPHQMNNILNFWITNVSSIFSPSVEIVSLNKSDITLSGSLTKFCSSNTFS